MRGVVNVAGPKSVVTQNKGRGAGGQEFDHPGAGRGEERRAKGET